MDITREILHGIIDSLPQKEGPCGYLTWPHFANDFETENDSTSSLYHD